MVVRINDSEIKFLGRRNRRTRGIDKFCPRCRYGVFHSRFGLQLGRSPNDRNRGRRVAGKSQRNSIGNLRRRIVFGVIELLLRYCVTLLGNSYFFLTGVCFSFCRVFRRITGRFANKRIAENIPAVQQRKWIASFFPL